MEDNREVLIRESEQLNIIVKTMISGARLDYRKTGLTFEDEVLDALLRSIAPVLYYEKIKELKSEE